MKKVFICLAVLYFICTISLHAQFGRLIDKAVNAAANEVLHKDNNSNKELAPEPSCACDSAELILNLEGNLKLNYQEINISAREDGALLVKDRISGNFYIAKGGVPEGPIPAGDKRLEGFEITDENDNSADALVKRFSRYITRSGEKYNINFGGKTYGPFAEIKSFVVTKSKEKFGATVIENVAVTAEQGKKLEDAMKNAKTDQERMDLAIQYAQTMQQAVTQGGGPSGMMPKFITNTSGSTYDPNEGGNLTSEMKYDDILVVSYDGITDLHGKKTVSIKPDHIGSDIYINTNNTKYAVFNYGELIFSDNVTYNELFNPHLMKGSDGKIYLAYMYFSPKRNSLMQCKIPF